MTFIKDIDELKQVVKINATIPWESLQPFLNDALDIYIAPQIGESTLIKVLEQNDNVVVPLVRRAQGPLALALGTHELGVMFGDSGITVDNQQGKRSPANEVKIANARENLFFRGMQALDRLLSYLDTHPEEYPEYIEFSQQTKTVNCLVKSAQEYQNIGMVNIDYSVMTYRELIPTMCQLQERNLRSWLNDELYEKLLKGGKLTTKELVLKNLCIRYVCNGSAALYTSMTSHQERQHSGKLEYQPLIRPLYRDIEDNGNFFQEQADFYTASIHNFLNENATELGVAPSTAGIDFNRKDKKIFTSVV